MILFCFIIVIYNTNSNKSPSNNYPQSTLDNSERILLEEKLKFESIKEFKKNLEAHRFNIECASIYLRNDSTAVQNVLSFSDKLKYLHKSDKIRLNKDPNFIFDKSLCEDYKIARGYNLIDRFIDEIEFNFPIAYSILIYHHVEQIDRLLKFIWRPQNIYCFHIDSKSTDSFKKAVRSITNCFDNVFITEKSQKIVWGSFSILQAELDCMKDLMNSKTAWKYLIHMSGDEFPLKTNYELVKILSIYNGANDIDINYGLELELTLAMQFIKRSWYDSIESKINHHMAI